MDTDMGANVDEPKPRMSLNTWLVATAVGLLLATGSIALYMKLGHPLALEPADYSTQSDLGITPVHQEAGDISVLLEGLKEKLERNPDNGPGWALLARSYVELKRHHEALAAFEEAIERIPDDAQLFVDYADALGVAHGGVLNDG
ncbi:MAG: tetratricopeptide repeat protein, partial [Nitrospirota bacterium]|nr:tetratricopeptide repeat protein [Nitrospirota bacterium]